MAIRAYQDKFPKVGDGTFVDDSALVLGDVTLGSDCSIWPMSVARGDVNKITIGIEGTFKDVWY